MSTYLSTQWYTIYNRTRLNSILESLFGFELEVYKKIRFDFRSDIGLRRIFEIRICMMTINKNQKAHLEKCY